MMMLHRWSFCTRLVWRAEKVCEQLATRFQWLRIRSQLRDTRRIELSAAAEDSL